VGGWACTCVGWAPDDADAACGCLSAANNCTKSIG
jgi:hypothetical protein